MEQKRDSAPAARAMLLIVIIALGILFAVQGVVSCTYERSIPEKTGAVVIPEFDRCPTSLVAFADYFCDDRVEARYAGDVIVPHCPDEARAVFYLFHACVQGNLMDADATLLIRRIESAGCRRVEEPAADLVTL